MEDNVTKNVEVDTNGENNGTQVDKVDYEAEYNKQLLEIEKLREAIKKSNSENADYKRKERESMSAEQQKAQDLKELIDSKKALEEELARIKLEKDFAEHGFTSEEIKALTESNFSAESISALIESRKKAWEKDFTLKQIKDKTPKQGLSSGDGATTETVGERLAKNQIPNNSQSIKNIYK